MKRIFLAWLFLLMITPINTMASQDTTYSYTNATVNVRQEPNATSKIITQSHINTKYKVISDNDGWSMVVLDDQYAYIKSNYLSETMVKYSDNDLYIMAHLLAGECQSCPDDEQLYVGSVALNRVNSPLFPNSLEEVVYQPGQYACTWDGNFYREPTERNWYNAKRLLENGSILPENIIWQSSRRQGKGVYLRTQYHYYCY